MYPVNHGRGISAGVRLRGSARAGGVPTTDHCSSATAPGGVRATAPGGGSATTAASGDCATATGAGVGS